MGTGLGLLFIGGAVLVLGPDCKQTEDLFLLHPGSRSQADYTQDHNTGRRPMNTCPSRRGKNLAGDTGDTDEGCKE